MAAFWNGSDPVGQRFFVPSTVLPPAAGAAVGPEATFTVIGVSEDFRLYSVDQAIAAQFYVPVRHYPGTGGRMLVRAGGDPYSVIPAMKEAVHAADPNAPVE